jgi:ribosomal protein S18 acetylase RimI-like enzyme
VASLFKSTGAIWRHFWPIRAGRRAGLRSRGRYDDDMTTPAIRPAGVDDLDALAPLFDAYRRFYEQPGDVALASAFLHDRLERSDSTILVAEDAGLLVGFCQLYPSWCSVAAARIFVLYDLFVDPDARRAGVARALMRAAQAFGRRAGAVRLDLTTARTNTRAQALYESEGWQRDDVFLTYNLALVDARQTP